jgi:hypothetical protein
MFKSLFLLLTLAAGVVPVPRKTEITFTAVTVGNEIVDHATIKGLDVWLVGDNVVVSLAGQVLASGPPSILDSLPGGTQSATAGASGCWLVPIEGGGLLLTSVDTTGHGASIGQAVADYHAQTKAMEAAGCEHMPWSECE